jgi:hypothetical protein
LKNDTLVDPTLTHCPHTSYPHFNPFLHTVGLDTMK